MKKLFILLFILSKAFAQSPAAADSSQIKWSDQLLTIQDFKGAVPDSSAWAALTSSKIYFSFQTYNDKLSSFVIYASFDPVESWMKTKTQAILQHEQLHFDITEVYARKLYSQLKSQKGTITSKQMAQMFSDINQQWGDAQDQYDLETSHGTKSDAQDQWTQKVKQWLNDYERYPAKN